MSLFKQLVLTIFTSVVIVTLFMLINPVSFVRTNPELDLPQIFSNETPIYQHTLVPVHSFSPTIESITTSDLRLGLINGTIAVTEDAKPYVTVLFELSEYSLKVLSTTDSLVSFLSNGQTALISWEETQAQWSILDVDGVSLLRPTTLTWPLISESHAPSNFDRSLLSTIAVTGVTAISRGVEYEITRRNDPLYPARGIMDILSLADITHVDSENPFFDNCIPETEGTVLCGKTRSIASLTAIGTDIVDLTGNHQNDYGVKANLESIQNLTDEGIQHFGGGTNQNDAEAILYKTVNGTTYAFVGYNYFDSLNGKSYGSLALEDRPGSNFYSDQKLSADIAKAKEKANVLFVHFQFIETYAYHPLSDQVDVFRRAIDLGADVVVGVQSHQPQTVEFYNGGTIFYGLGNFFFDQMWSYPTRQGLIPWMSFYNGEHLNTYLYTTLLYDYSQPRFTTGTERVNLLTEILD